MTDRELAACPFCGGEAHLTFTEQYGGFVSCSTENCAGDSHRAQHVRAEIITAWNRRTPSSEGDGRDAEDARAWRQWCESVSAEQIVALNEKFGGALGLVRDAARYRWLRENDNANMLAEDVIDDAIAAAEGENHG